MNEFFILVLSSVISLLIAYWFGDVAGTKAAIKYEKEKERDAYKIAILALLNQIQVVKKLAQHNTNDRKYLTDPLAKMPVTAFETAFLKGKESILTVNVHGAKNDLNIVSTYLAEAYTVNNLVDMYMSFGIGSTGTERLSINSKLQEASKNILKTLEHLEAQLNRDLESLKVLEITSETNITKSLQKWLEDFFKVFKKLEKQLRKELDF